MKVKRSRRVYISYLHQKLSAVDGNTKITISRGRGHMDTEYVFEQK